MTDQSEAQRVDALLDGERDKRDEKQRDIDARTLEQTDKLRGDMRVALSAAARLRKDLEKATPMPEGTVVRFTSQSNDSHRYNYAAIFAAGQWWFTGQGNSYWPRSCSHQEFTSLMVARGQQIIGLAVATGWEGIEL